MDFTKISLYELNELVKSYCAEYDSHCKKSFKNCCLNDLPCDEIKYLYEKLHILSKKEKK